MNRFKWVAFSHDSCYADNSEKCFDTAEECYLDMRERALEKMTWNTEPTDFEDGMMETIGYRVLFEKRLIVHTSYSGVYVYLIVAEDCNPTYYDVFNNGLVSYLVENGMMSEFEADSVQQRQEDIKNLAELKAKLMSY